MLEHLDKDHDIEQPGVRRTNKTQRDAIFDADCLGPAYRLKSFSTYDAFREWLRDNSWIHDREKADAIAASALRSGVDSAWLGEVGPEEVSCDGANYRERLLVRGLNARQRAVLELLTVAAGYSGSGSPAIYVTEAFGAFASELRGRFPKFVGSEYAPTREQQAAIAPVEHQDITALTYPDELFDLAISNDVFEHVADLPRALAELRRILKKNGILLATFPFSAHSETTLIKARRRPDGSIEHLEDPEYHDNPLDPAGSLVFQIPGWDMCVMAQEAGFDVAEYLVITSDQAGLTGAGSPGLFLFAARALKGAKPEPVKTSHPNGHFYSPVVDPVEAIGAAARLWPAHPEILGIDFNEDSHRRILSEIFPLYAGDYNYPEKMPGKSGDENRVKSFFGGNSQFSWLDSRALYVLLRHWRPKRLIEVGSGFSTLLIADVNARYLNNSLDITCIEPYPRDFLLRSRAHRLIRKKVQEVPLAEFEKLQAGDILFIDSSHVAKTGSDVNFLYFEILPRLASGVRVHIHDIFLPHDYPRTWVIDENRSWNEQYLLRALLMHSTAFRVVFGCNYAFSRFPDFVSAALGQPDGKAFPGGSFWIERV